jgi:hypothetical protein
MKTFGAAMWILGLFLILGALFGMDTTIATNTPASTLPGMPDFPDRVVNLQLQQLQMLIAQSGMALFVAGVIAHCAGNLAEVLGGPSAAALDRITYAEQVDMPHKGTSVAELVGAGETDEAIMERYGITQDGEHYVYGGFRYDRLADAAAYARKQINR